MWMWSIRAPSGTAFARTACIGTWFTSTGAKRIPELAAYDCMLVMGGPQDVWEEDAHPWLVPEKAAIRRFVAELKRPFLGICLGHQLLADALGGTVAPGTPEVGVMTIAQTPAGREDALLNGLPEPMTVLQWHGAEVTALPPDATLLASSADCRVQAFRAGPRAFGLQCHVEVGADMVDEWAAIPAYAASLRRALGEDGLGAAAARCRMSGKTPSAPMRVGCTAICGVWLKVSGVLVGF